MKKISNSFFFSLFVIFPVFACNSKNDSTSKVKKESKDPTAEINPSEVYVPAEAEAVSPTTTEPIVVAATEKPAIRRFLFNGGSEVEDLRYKAEYLLIVKALERSCVKLYTRPGSDSSKDVSKQNIDDFCSISKSDSSSDNAASGNSGNENSESQTSESANLTSVQKEKSNQEIFLNTSGLQLKSISNSLCAQRLFHFKGEENAKPGQGSGLQTVLSKTAFLVSKAENINVWLDAEIGNPCKTGTLINLEKRKFSLGKKYSKYKDAWDQLTLSHLDNMAAEAQRIYNTLIPLYGNVSDVDSNGAVDIFISPEINRSYFYDEVTAEANDFQVYPIYRPEDRKKFSTETNPTSNESEVIYVWSPDPGGLYTYDIYPSANSLTSNYLKGYVASQLMSLIIENSHVFTNNSNPEENWLRQGLSLLAADYVAGNDYTSAFKEKYLMARSQQISLTSEGVIDDIPFNFKNSISEQEFGMQVLYAWYLHSRLCGQTVSPCANLKNLIQTAKIGKANIESVMGQTFSDVFEGFGVSLGIELSDAPDSIRTNLQNSSGSFVKPVQFPKISEILSFAPPQTYEIDKTATVVSGSFDDRTLAGPFPGYDTLLYQPLVPEGDLEIVLQKNSLTYILVSSLLEEESEVMAGFGAAVSATIVPLGNRDSSKRKVHIEKISESAHIDLRPTNLTTVQDSEKTYYTENEYSSDFTVTGERQIWLLGSIDNMPVKVKGTENDSSVLVQDVDAFNIEIDPCKNAQDEAGCKAKTHTVLAQIIPRDFSKELTPMLFVAPTDLEIYAGQVFMRKMSTIDATDFQDIDENIYIACLSEYMSDPTNPSYSALQNCGNGGLTKADYQTRVCAANPKACLDAMPDQAASFNMFTASYLKSLDQEFEMVSYDNFFHAGSFFYDNIGSLKYEPNLFFGGPRSFHPEEINRQFFNFSYDKKAVDLSYHFHSIAAGIPPASDIDFDSSLLTVDPAVIQIFLDLRSVISGAKTNSSDIKTNCQSLGISNDICEDPLTNWQLLDIVAQNFFKDSRAICLYNSSKISSKNQLKAVCPGSELTTKGSASGGGEISVWLKPERFLLLSSQEATELKTYYVPVIPQEDNAYNYCTGNSKNGASPPCVIAPSLFNGDIRNQLNIPSAYYSTSTKGLTFGEDFLVGADPYSIVMALTPGKIAPDRFLASYFSKARVRSFRPFAIQRPSGNIVGKQGQIHDVTFEVKGDQVSRVLMFAGGLNRSQGRYLIRVKLVSKEAVL